MVCLTTRRLLHASGSSVLASILWDADHSIFKARAMPELPHGQHRIWLPGCNCSSSRSAASGNAYHAAGSDNVAMKLGKVVRYQTRPGATRQPAS